MMFVRQGATLENDGIYARRREKSSPLSVILSV